MATQKWNADKDHSKIEFHVKYMTMIKVTGTFKEYEIEAKSKEGDFSDGNISFVAKTKSINTGTDKRDEHLKSSDFFDASKYPEITFQSTKYEKEDKHSFKLTGDLTIKGKTKKVTLDGKHKGISTDPMGNEKAGFSLKVKINRKDWGMDWNETLDTGGVIASNEVKITCEVLLNHAS